MTVWIVTRSIPSHSGSGGMERVAYDLACDLRRVTDEPVAILTTRMGRVRQDNLAADEVEVHSIRFAPPGRYSMAWWLLTSRSKLVAPHDKVLSISNGAAGIMLLRRRPPCTVIQAHGTPWSELRGIMRHRDRLWMLRAARMVWWQCVAVLCYRRAACVVGVGESVVSRLRAEPGARFWRAAKVRCIPNVARADAVTFSHSRRHRGRQELGVDGDRQLIVAVGRLVFAKGVDRMLRAMSSLPDYELVVVGEGSEMPALRRLAEAECPGRCHFTGALSPERVGDVLAASDIFVFPSRAPEREGLPMSALEAQVSGLPIVASIGSPIPTTTPDYLQFVNFDETADVCSAILAIDRERVAGPQADNRWAELYGAALGVTLRPT